MTFLAPWALGLAALTAVPIALHLFRRDTRRRLAFPAIRYLRRARDRSARALKLRDRLLLVTRGGLVAALALAAAAPLAGRGDESDHAPTDLVLLIDNTGSMNRIAGDSTLLDRQRSRALQLLDAARSSDRFWVLPAVGPVLASGIQAGAAVAAVGRIEATDAAADLGAGVREALRLLPPGAGRPREIVVLSDFQASSVRGEPFEVPDDVSLTASRIVASPENAAVIDLQVEPPRAEGDGSVVVLLAPPDVGTLPDTVEVRLTVGGETVSIARAGAGGTTVLRLPDPGVGEHAISVEIPPSGLRSDDRRHLVLRTFEPPGVRHSGPVDSYVGRALETLAQAERLRLLEAPGRPAAWFAEGIPPAGLSDTSGSVWILTPPGDEDLLARFNAGLDRLGVPWRVDLVDAPGSVAPLPSSYVPGLESIRLRGRHRLMSIGTGSDTVLMRTTDGAPWMVAGRLTDRTYLLIRTPLLPEYTDLPVSAAMLPFMEAVLFRWAGLGGDLPAPAAAGEPVRLPATADSVSTPAGGTDRVDGGSPYTPLRAGVYTVFLANGATSLLAACVPTSESDLREAPTGEFTRALGAPRSAVATTDGEWRAAMYGSRRGISLAPYLTALALLLVLSEAALATPRERARLVRRRPSTDRHS